MEMLDWALRYAEMGYDVFPLKVGTKVPMTQHGVKAATRDVERIKHWWTATPHANIGIATERLLVVDIDDAGYDWPATVEQCVDVDATMCCVTPRGGRHYYFRASNQGYRSTVKAIAPCIDTRGLGGYVVAPPSRLADGGYYEWRTDVMAYDELLLVPDWLDALIRRPAGGRQSMPITASGTIPNGQRNQTLTRYAGAMRRYGMAADEILAGLRVINANRCTPPLDDIELRGIAASVGSMEPDLVQVAIIEQQVAEQSVEREAVVYNAAIDESLLQCPGLVNDIVSYNLSTAHYPDRTLAFVGALAMQCLLSGRRVIDDFANRTHLYLLTLAAPGTGKEHARQVNLRLANAIGMSDAVVNAIASGEGLEDRLAIEPALLAQVDEFDCLLNRAVKATDARNETLVASLLQLYSASTSQYAMRLKANQPARHIDQPCLTLFGTAVPRSFYQSINDRLMTGGLYARMLVFHVGKRGIGQEAIQHDLPNDIVRMAASWLRVDPRMPRLVTYDEGAMQALGAVRQDYDRLYSLAEEQGDDIGMTLWARGREKVCRLALLRACSRTIPPTSITASDVEWASQLVRAVTQQMLAMAATHYTDDPIAAKALSVLETLRRWQSRFHAPMPYYAIARQHRWSARIHEAIRHLLVQQQRIHITYGNGKRGRNGIYYSLASECDMQE